jgi:hypothetical protein
MATRHAGRALTEEQRARWVTLAGRAADEAGLPADPSFRAAFLSCIEWGSRVAVAQSQPDAPPPGGTTMPRWDWGAAGPPDAPAGPAQDEQDSRPVAEPGPGEAVSFATHIRPLFRQRDRQSMTFAFDLWSHDDVQAHAPDILERLRNGSMPCDGAWADDKIGLFQRWAESGMQP